MAEQEKVMTATLMRSDLRWTFAYLGGRLGLPASPSEIQDAMDRARIRSGQEYLIAECLDMDGGEIGCLPDSPSLAELNFLARRLRNMSEYEQKTFNGCVKMGRLNMKGLINLTYSLDQVHVVQAGNDRELGRFYAGNGFIDALEDIPAQHQEEVFDFLDFEKIGRRQREAEGGVFLDGEYVVRESPELRPVYNGLHLPALPQEPSYGFRLTLISMPPDSNIPPEDMPSVPLDLPAGEREIGSALRKLGAASLDDCVFSHCASPIPALDQAFSFSEDIGKMNELASRLSELGKNGQLPKFKAALEAANCSDIDEALDLTHNLDCFDFYPDLISPEDYAKQRFLEKYHIPADEPMTAQLRFVQSDAPKMEQDMAFATPYGIIRRSGRQPELQLSRTEPELRLQ